MSSYHIPIEMHDLPSGGTLEVFTWGWSIYAADGTHIGRAYFTPEEDQELPYCLIAGPSLTRHDSIDAAALYAQRRHRRSA